MIGSLVSSGKADLHQLGTVYSLQDAYDLLEVVMIDAHNSQAVREHYEEKARGNNH